jgi:hypothetical protein
MSSVGTTSDPGLVYRALWFPPKPLVHCWVTCSIVSTVRNYISTMAETKV